MDAGYKARGNAATVNASKLLTKTNIKAYVQELRDARSKRTNINADWVFKKLEKLTEICMAATPVKVRIKGVMVETGEYKVDSYGANKAIETITKCLGMYKEKEDNPAINIYNMLGGHNGDKSDSELETEFAKKSAIIGSGNGRPINRL
jgi:phage terminase small subunit